MDTDLNMNPGIAKQREPCYSSPKNTVKDVRPHVFYAAAILPIGPIGVGGKP